MIDPALLRDSPDEVAANFDRRGQSVDQGRFRELDGRIRDMRRQEEGMRARLNKISKEFPALRKSGEDEKARQAQEEAAELGDSIKKMHKQTGELAQELDDFMLRLPNLLHHSVPDGDSEKDNRLVEKVGEPPSFGFEPRDHVELGSLHGFLDFDTPGAMAQSRFSLLSGTGAALHRALAQMMLDMHVREHGYVEQYVPYMVNTRSMTNSGQLPKFGGDHEFFSAAHDDLHLIPTAEVPLTNLAADRTFAAADLPQRFVSHSPCFRREAGSYGKDTRGMLRQHQFDKVELVQVAHPDQSADAHEEMLGHAKRVLDELRLPYQVVELCAGDTGAAAHRTFDLEVWLPGQGRYREISSVSNDTDYQARRMRARLKKDGAKGGGFVHILNGSGVAVGRAWIAVVENCQQENGDILVPGPLRPYMGGAEVLKAPA